MTITRKRVRTDADHIDHVVSFLLFFDGGAPSMCGRKVWPGKWLEVSPGDESTPLCAGCVEKLRGKR